MGKRSIPPCLLFTFLFGHELFMSAYLYAVRGKRVKTPATHTIATVSVANAFWSSDPCPVRLCLVNSSSPVADPGLVQRGGLLIYNYICDPL